MGKSGLVAAGVVVALFGLLIVGVGLLPAERLMRWQTRGPA